MLVAEMETCVESHKIIGRIGVSCRLYCNGSSGAMLNCVIMRLMDLSLLNKL